MSEINRVAKAICKSKTCEGFMCCQHPAQMGRLKCPVESGGYDDAARAAIEAMRYPGTATILEATKGGRKRQSNAEFWHAMFEASLSKANSPSEKLRELEAEMQAR